MNWGSIRKHDDRGITPVVAVILLVGLVAMSATLTVIAGMSLVDELQSQQGMEQAETTMQQTQSDLQGLVSSQDDDRTEVLLDGLEGGDTDIVDDGSMTIYLNHGHEDEGSATLDVGTLEYRDGGDRIGYQAGGVWKSTEDSSTVVSPPDLTYTVEEINGREVRQINFPAANVDPDSSLGGSSLEARIDEAEQNKDLTSEVGLPPDPDDEDHVDRVRSVRIEVEDNGYVDAWEAFFNSEFGDEYVSTNENTVTLIPIHCNIAVSRTNFHVS